MQVLSLNDLKKLIKACRALGVDKIEIDGIKLELGPIPTTYRRHASKVVRSVDGYKETYLPGGIDANTPIPLPDQIHMPDELTEEQKLFWSAEGGGQSLGPGETV